MPKETPYPIIDLHVSPALLRAIYDALYMYSGTQTSMELDDKERKEIKTFLNYLRNRYGEVLHVAAEAIN